MGGQDDISGLPQPLRLQLNWPKPPTAAKPAADWSEPSKYQRDIAKWIVGGVLATVVGIVAGSSLTKLGSLDFVETPLRLGLALGGASTGFAAIGVFLWRALRVLSQEAGGVNRLASGDPEWIAIAAKVNEVFEHELGQTDGQKRTVQQLIADRKAGTLSDDDTSTLHKIRAMLGFLFVQYRFNRLIAALPAVGVVAIAGFGLFAWAANPPNPPAKPDKGITIRIAG